jgi:hypothetical protein
MLTTRLIACLVFDELMLNNANAMTREKQLRSRGNAGFS